MFGIGQPELIIIIFVLLLFFGPSKLPKLSKTLGESGRALKDGFTGGKNDKSLKDITEEVASSAREIRDGIAEVKNNTFKTEVVEKVAEPTEGVKNPIAEAQDTPPLTETQGYGSTSYGKQENI